MSFTGPTRSWIESRLSLIIVLFAATFIASARSQEVEDVSPSVSLLRTARVVILIGEDEYQTWETLPAFAASELRPPAYDVRLVHEDPGDKHLFPNLIGTLRNADLLVVSVRRRALPQEQLEAIRTHLNTGKPLIGLRTASHAFAVRGADRQVLIDHPERAEWASFDAEVLGGNYTGHHGAGPITVLRPVPAAARHPVLAGFPVTAVSDDGLFESVASLYRTSPLATGATPLLTGKIPGQPPEPVAWTHSYGPQKARVFYTSLGHPQDFKNPVFRRLLLNAIGWALDRPVTP
jgi:type 1 glutamine amidotransferase